MSRFVLAQADFVSILKTHGFTLKRQVGSHQQWEGTTGNRRRLVTVDTGFSQYSGWLLSSMIRQSGLPKSAFRNR
ncbi:MAG: type II toxin-antitoxin system HicA family toxin [Candidatus Omnitrophica bacterium]|nr:type II toxin-antitoxin system HicA family toxin [Candidatus Omnitrophota bacterium]